MTDDPVQRKLRDDLRHSSYTERQKALVRIGDMGCRGAVEWVLPLLDDPNVHVRIDALLCLRELRDSTAVPRLIDAVRRASDDEEREFGITALAAFTAPEVRDCVLSVLDAEESSNLARMNAVMQLWRYPDEQTIQRLQQIALNDPDRNVRSHAADSLAFIFGALGLPATWRPFWEQTLRDPEVGVSRFGNAALGIPDGEGDG